MEKSPGYEYIVVPNISEQKLHETSTNNRNIEILANTESMQAVKHKLLEQVHLAFYKSGEIEILKGQLITIESQGMALLKMSGNKVIEMSVADPSRTLSKMIITLPAIYNSKKPGFTCFPNSKTNTTMLIIELPQGVYSGKSITLKL